MSPDQSFRGRRGTPYFYAPEVWFEKTMLLKSDIFSIGAITFLLLTGNYMI
jgi:serine/threonine protein kinase